MFVSFPKALGIFGSVLGVGGIGTVGAYATTKKTISDSLGEYRIVDKNVSNERAWTKLKKKLEESNGIDGKQKPKSKVFENLQKQPKEEDLKNACQNSRQEIYWTIFSKDSDLLDDVKNFCAITIKDSFEEGKLFKSGKSERNAEQTKFEGKMDELKQHETKKPEQKIVGDLEELYKKIKISEKPKESWTELAEWCDKSYKSYFFNENDDLWKNVDTYCKQ